MFGDLDWPQNAARGLSAIAEFLVPSTYAHTRRFAVAVLLFYFQNSFGIVRLIGWSHAVMLTRTCKDNDKDQAYKDQDKDKD